MIKAEFPTKRCSGCPVEGLRGGEPVVCGLRAVLKIIFWNQTPSMAVIYALLHRAQKADLYVLEPPEFTAGLTEAYAQCTVPDKNPEGRNCRMRIYKE